MEQPQDLFGNYKYCEECKRPLPLTYKENLCPSCIEQKLFREVKEYIRENDVNEYDVAQHFHIPHMQVKKWIREGRIEYKDDHLNTITAPDAAHRSLSELYVPNACARRMSPFTPLPVRMSQTAGCVSLKTDPRICPDLSYMI